MGVKQLKGVKVGIFVFDVCDVNEGARKLRRKVGVL